MHQRTGTANLPLHGGHVPLWLSTRMAALGRVIAEAIVHEYGRDELLLRLAHPFWFQSFGAVMGMDWHSSGITTSVVGALKRGLAPVQHELGIYVCGGKGAHSRRTPQELFDMGEMTGIDAASLVRSSRLVAKIDSAAVQDGYDLYLHAFFATAEGHWCVVQQGMNENLGEARRYHWQSQGLHGFFESPHAAIEGRNVGAIVNLADARAQRSRAAGLDLVWRGPDRTISVLRRLRNSSNATLPLFPETETITQSTQHLQLPHHHGRPVMGVFGIHPSSPKELFSRLTDAIDGDRLFRSWPYIGPRRHDHFYGSARQPKLGRDGPEDDFGLKMLAGDFRPVYRSEADIQPYKVKHSNDPALNNLVVGSEAA